MHGLEYRGWSDIPPPCKILRTEPAGRRWFLGVDGGRHIVVRDHLGAAAIENRKWTVPVPRRNLWLCNGRAMLAKLSLHDAYRAAALG
ncbi:MAG: hypothetical protein CMJ64_01495 [Planctomycetaceae bacterium]|nr:hypothetical protein [Planctomycetaceae bacterium]